LRLEIVEIHPAQQCGEMSETMPAPLSIMLLVLSPLLLPLNISGFTR
jgi:hypothetical protein